MHAEQARDDLRLTTSQRSLRQRTQDLRDLPLTIARRLVSKHRATLQVDAVARSKIPNSKANYPFVCAPNMLK